MADVRALLKAKRQEARINHPYAAYGANGALRCTACGVAVKFASAWEGHLGGKSHRAAVAKLKAKEEEESARAAATATATATATAPSKRKAAAAAEERDGGDDDDRQMEVEVGTVVEQARPGKRQRTEEREMEGQGQGQAQEQASRPFFPADFFSDPARAPPREDEDGDDEMDQDREVGKEDTTRAGAAAAAPKGQFDVEWDAFEREMQSLSHQRRPTVDPQVAFAHATTVAEPELVSSFVGLPASSGTQGGGDAGGGAQGAEGAEGRKAVAISEEQERKRKEMDERELIMDRLVEEERAQEDAYNRVALLRNKMQALKQKRELAKAKGKKADTQT